MVPGASVLLMVTGRSRTKIVRAWLIGGAVQVTTVLPAASGVMTARKKKVSDNIRPKQQGSLLRARDLRIKLVLLVVSRVCRDLFYFEADVRPWICLLTILSKRG